MLSRARTVFLLALTAAIIVAQEVLLTRLLSLTTYYSLAFVVINLAMVGLTAGSLRAARAEQAKAPLGPWIGRMMTVFAVSLLAANLLTPHLQIVLYWDAWTVWTILRVAAINTVPMVAGGAVIARLMAAGRAPVSILYGVDLVAAAAGALAPLVLLGPFTATGAMLLLAVLAATGAWIAAPKPRALRLLVLSLAVVAVFVSERQGGLVTRAKGKKLPFPEGTTQRWSALSHVALTPLKVYDQPAFWSPSPAFQTRGVYPISQIYIDADAWTPIHAYRDPAEVTFLRYDGITAAHALRPGGTACVIGVGGGRDVLAALHYGHPRVVGVEINPDIVELLREMAHVSPVATDPRVELITGDGRSVLAGRDIQCSVLQASLIDTWAATSAGAFAHTEATLYTREAWSLFLRRVEPDGIVTFSRWYRPQKFSELVRLVSLAMTALLDRGVTRPRDHVAVLSTSLIATILVSPRPFSEADRDALARLESEMKFTFPVAPGRAAADPLIERLLEAKTVDELAEAGADRHIDTSAPTDDRPFFFQLLAPKAWLQPGTLSALYRGGVGGGVVPGNVMAMLGMVVMLATVLAIGIVLLGPTIVRSLRARPAALPSGSAWIYFAALGAGFMIAEIALVQRMHVVLGHPTYALIVVLAGMLVATGAGSALSPHILRSRRSVSIAALIAAAWLVVLPLFVIGPLAERTMHASLAVRALWTGSCAALAGLLLGMFFPSGLRFTHRELGAPAALAINGVTSVIGGGAAIMVSVAFGISASFVLAAVFYLLAALSGPTRWPGVES